jgi:hypothetical protein
MIALSHLNGNPRISNALANNMNIKHSWVAAQQTTVQTTR